MKVNVTARHIKAGRLSHGHRTPIELAVEELDCFEEVWLKAAGDRVSLMADGSEIRLPRKVQEAVRSFRETGTMNPMTFELKLDRSVLLGGDGFLSNPWDELQDFGYGFSYA